MCKSNIMCCVKSDTKITLKRASFNGNGINVGDVSIKGRFFLFGGFGDFGKGSRNFSPFLAVL